MGSAAVRTYLWGRSKDRTSPVRALRMCARLEELEIPASVIPPKMVRISSCCSSADTRGGDGCRCPSCRLSGVDPLGGWKGIVPASLSVPSARVASLKRSNRPYRAHGLGGIHRIYLDDEFREGTLVFPARQYRGRFGHAARSWRQGY
jgi:hypothetical protein